ncbi:MAG: hypothetical protein A2992_06800 [Elusimicrobia bacterium RIFCSPLOWO2_01_FULL_59_12]|nr:MAG: hypothetical protein A2992_06800 [Elusimicrobia bacterium RIFCSPLOWO2_01_FULL_59_12]
MDFVQGELKIIDESLEKYIHNVSGSDWSNARKLIGKIEALMRQAGDDELADRALELSKTEKMSFRDALIQTSREIAEEAKNV